MVLSTIILTLTSTVSTNLFISGVTLATTTYIGIKKTKKKSERR